MIFWIRSFLNFQKGLYPRVIINLLKTILTFKIINLIASSGGKIPLTLSNLEEARNLLNNYTKPLLYFSSN